MKVHTNWQHSGALCKAGAAQQLLFHIQVCCTVLSDILHWTLTHLRVIVIKGNFVFAFDLRFHWLCLSAFEKQFLILDATVVASIYSPSQKCPLIPFSVRWIFVSCEGERGDKIAPNMSIITDLLQMDQLSFRKTVPQGPELWTAHIFHWVLMRSWNLLSTWKWQKILLLSDSQTFF